MEIRLYDRKGRLIAYSENKQDIYLVNGKPVAYFYDDSIYSFSGTHLGRFENGWVKDNSGRYVFFTDDATGSGPIKPIKQISPIKGIKNIKPIKGIKEIKPIKRINTLSWSRHSGRSFFDQ